MIDLREVLEQKQALERQFDFHFESTFWEEFSIADGYGPDGIREHYNLVFNQWKDNLRFLQSWCWFSTGRYINGTRWMTPWG